MLTFLGLKGPIFLGGLLISVVVFQGGIFLLSFRGLSLRSSFWQVCFGGLGELGLPVVKKEKIHL